MSFVDKLGFKIKDNLEVTKVTFRNVLQQEIIVFIIYVNSSILNKIEIFKVITIVKYLLICQDNVKTHVTKNSSFENIT